MAKREQFFFARAIIGVWVGSLGGRLVPTSSANEGYYADISGRDVEMRACSDSVRSQSIGFLGAAVGFNTRYLSYQGQNKLRTHLCTVAQRD